MKTVSHRSHAVLAFLLFAALSPGCGDQARKSMVFAPKTDAPALSVRATRAGSSYAGMSRYTVRWEVVAGSASHFVYAVNPPSADRVDESWISTHETSLAIEAPARRADLSPSRDAGYPATNFVVRAVDRSGRMSPAGGISIINDNLAPEVRITSPIPSSLLRAYVPRLIEIQWQGLDPDGVGMTVPVLYKWKLLTNNTEVPFQLALAFPDSVRRYYEPGGYADWDSTGGAFYDQPAVKFENLIPGSDYLFVVVGRDQLGAWNQVFTLDSNMLNMRCTFDGSSGPLLTMYNESFTYTYPSASYSVAPQYQVPLAIPPNTPVTVHWYGQPNPGATLVAYRWALDIADVTDETPRVDELTDLSHWSAPNPAATSATVGPFAPGETHLLFIEATDSNGLRSLGMVRMTSIEKTLERDLLIVDDTRFSVDQRTGSACMNAPIGRWPTAAELDTFLYARGGVPWRCYPTGTTSAPGLFAGYLFDTLGTRGLPGGTVPLAALAPYRHVLWLTDGVGATFISPATNPTNPITALRLMTQVGRQNTLATYVTGGGSVWVAGGGVAYASLINFNRTNNDATPSGPSVTFSSLNNELTPGRFPYDLAGWRSEIKVSSSTATVTRSLGRFEGVGSLYASLPTSMQAKTAATDPFPPGRPVIGGNFYVTNFELEYLSRPNEVVDDIDPSPLAFDLQSTLDTLYKATGGSLVPPGLNPVDVVMTRYHPTSGESLIFTGFNIWSFRRSDCKSLVDFVLQQLWGLSPGPSPQIARAVSGEAWRPVRRADR